DRFRAIRRFRKGGQNPGEDRRSRQKGGRSGKDARPPNGPPPEVQCRRDHSFRKWEASPPGRRCSHWPERVSHMGNRVSIKLTYATWNPVSCPTKVSFAGSNWHASNGSVESAPLITLH